MQLLADALVAVLLGYIALVNWIAAPLERMFPATEPAPAEETAASEPLAALPAKYERFRLPDILLRSVEYQQAALGAASSEPRPVDDPLLALVNIYCTFTTREYVRTTTGTGFFVHHDGVIMTNAHVAQFLLLGTTDALGTADCVVRNGNPAAAAYRAELLYMPPAWVRGNAAMIDVAAPTGTGERDYALLYVAQSVDGGPLPALFPALAFDTRPLPHGVKGKAVRAAGYPATDIFSGRTGTLSPRLATTTISELYTFGSNLADVFSVRGSSVGAGGSSGGPIMNEEGRVVGMIATRGDDSRDGVGSLRAITLSHIDRTITEETGFSLARNVSGNIPYRADIFKRTLAPFLLSILTSEIGN